MKIGLNAPQDSGSLALEYKRKQVYRIILFNGDFTRTAAKGCYHCFSLSWYLR